MVIGATTTQYTSVANPVGKNLVGNSIKITSGTGFTLQRVQIVSTSTITATCDKSLGTTASTGGHGNLGGGFLSPGECLRFDLQTQFANGNLMNIKAGTYLISGTFDTAGGPIYFDGSGGNWSGATTLTTRFWGYGTVPGDHGTKPIIRANANTQTLVTLMRCTVNWENITVDGNSKTTLIGMTLSGAGGANAVLRKCKIMGCTANGIGDAGSAQIVMDQVEVTGCSGTNGAISWTSITAANLVGCDIHGNTGNGLYSSVGNVSIHRCNFYANTGGGLIGANGLRMVSECTFYGNGSGGAQASTSIPSIAVNCISEGNTGVGFSGFVTSFNNATYNNTSTADNATFIFGAIVGTGSFFTNAASGDFSLNNTAGAGALVRAAGDPGLFPAGTTTNYSDTGAAQHTAAAGGGSTVGLSSILVQGVV